MDTGSIASKAEHYQAACARLQNLMRHAHIDALVALKSENVQYLNVTASAYLSLGLPLGTAAVIVPREGEPIGVCTEAEHPTLSRSGMIRKWIDIPAWIGIDDQFLPPERRKPRRERSEFVNLGLNVAAIVEAVHACGAQNGRIGVELAAIPETLLRLLRDALHGTTIVDAAEVFYRSRAIKTPYEIACLRRAAEIQEGVLSEVMRQLEVGMSHAELLAKLRSRALAHEDIDEIRFMFVSVGPRFEPTVTHYDVRVAPGDLLRYDGALVHSGYGADAARTYIAGKPSKEQSRIHACMIRAHEKALSLMRPGIAPKAVFEAGMSSVWEQLPNYMRGHIGHSVGLDQIVEEPPFISPRSTEPMAPGNVFCLELPYYGYEFGSIMVEDIVLITETGCELLTKAPYALQPIGQHQNS